MGILNRGKVIREMKFKDRIEWQQGDDSLVWLAIKVLGPEKRVKDKSF